MIGLKITNNVTGDGFTVTGIDGADRVVLTPSNFGPVIPATLAELAEDYTTADTDAELPTSLPPTEADIIAEADARANEGLNQRYARAVLRSGLATGADQRGAGHRVTGPPEGSPEAKFAALAAEAETAPTARKRKGTTS
jgi:hypothetical protein